MVMGKNEEKETQVAELALVPKSMKLPTRLQQPLRRSRQFKSFKAVGGKGSLYMECTCEKIADLSVVSK